MKILQQALSMVVVLAIASAAVAQSVPPPAANGPQGACVNRSLLMNFDVYRYGQHWGQVPIWQLGSGPAFTFRSGMTIDADGAPNAYNADDTGLDELRNAGEPGHWDGIVQDEEGNPVVQGPDDPYPGYYISCTALFDRTKHHLDPTRFVDSTQIPYVALPGDLAEQAGARLGDFVVVFSERTGKYSYAIFADIGAFGEGSIALANNLGIWSDAREGGSRGGIEYLVFPGSGDGQPKSVDEINQRTAALVEPFGGAEQVWSCARVAAEVNVASLDAGPRLESFATQVSAFRRD